MSSHIIKQYSSLDFVSDMYNNLMVPIFWKMLVFLTIKSQVFSNDAVILIPCSQKVTLESNRTRRSLYRVERFKSTRFLILLTALTSPLGIFKNNSLVSPQFTDHWCKLNILVVLSCPLWYIKNYFIKIKF